MRRAIMYGALGGLLNWCGINAMVEPLKFVLVLLMVIIIDLFAEKGSV